MKAHGLARLGRDAEVRHIASGDAVCQLSLAFDRRVKGEKVTDWVDGSLWGKRAEALAPYLTKGSLVMVDLDDLHIETYEGKNGAGHKLAARVIDVGLTGGGKEVSGQPQEERKAPVQAKAPARAPDGFSDMADDIPF